MSASSCSLSVINLIRSYSFPVCDLKIVLNKNLPLRTKEEITEYMRNYQIKNKDRLKHYMKLYMRTYKKLKFD